MRKKNNKPLVPKWRFPEFRGSGEWLKMPLSELLTETKHRNRDLKYGREQVLSVSGEYGCVNQIELLGRSYAGVSVKDYHVVETRDIVYTKSPLKQNPFGIIKENKGKPGIVSTLYAVYRATDKGNPTFLGHYFSNDYNLNSYLQPIVRKGAKNDMKVNNFAVLGGEIIVPKPKEQQKIADCLTALDELITAEGGKLGAYKAHKKGLLQKLFPAEGKTVPEWRFPEFRGNGEWEESTLGKASTIVMGASPKSEFYNEEKNGLPLLQGNTDIKNRISAPRIFTSQITKECLINDILLSVRAPVGTVAKSIHHACIGRGIAAIRANMNNSQEFLYQWLFGFEPQWQNISQGGTFDAVNSDDIRQLSIGLPKLPEQQKIADCLTSLDEFITAQTQKIEALKTHKKSLMQGLFPSADEVDE